MSLTDDWKNGELPSGDEIHEWLSYYIKHKDGLIHSDSYWRGKWGIADRNSIEEVLAPVPSYEKLQELKHLEDLQANQDKEVESLRDLLKECKPYLLKELETLTGTGFYNCDFALKTYNTLTRINTAIGESEE